MFLIASLPDPRLAWIANYLSSGDSTCLYYGLNDHGIDLPCGNADPGNALEQDSLIAKFADAKWVIIDRNPEEIKGQGIKSLLLMQSKIEELRMKVNPMVVPYELLNDSILDIAKYVIPDWKHNELRHEMLLKMNVQLKESPKPTAKFDIGSTSLSQTCTDYLSALKRMCGDEIYAYVWLEQIIQVALVWDHLTDSGDIVGPGAVDSVMKTLVLEWPRNPFLRKYSDYLMPTAAASIAAWKYNNSRDLHYSVYRELACAVAFVIGGNQRVEQFMPEISELVSKMRAEDDIRDQ